MKVVLYRYYKRISRWFEQLRLYLLVAADSLLMHLGWYKNKVADKHISNELNKHDIDAMLGDRSVEVKENDYLLRQVIITTYFTQKKDPQHHIVRTQPSADYIAAWYNSIHRLSLNGIIIYDELPADFIRLYQTNAVQFRKYVGGEYSLYEERWMAGYLFLKETGIPYTFFTDISDVIINKDPFVPELNKDILFVGRDYWNRVWHSSYMLGEIKSYQKDSGFSFPRSFLYMPLYNAGIVGGNSRLLINVLEQMIVMVFKTKSGAHKDMALLNYVIYTQLNPPLKASLFEPSFTDPANDNAKTEKIYTGYPLNSAFRENEQNSGAFFSHK